MAWCQWLVCFPYSNNWRRSFLLFFISKLLWWTECIAQYLPSKIMSIGILVTFLMWNHILGFLPLSVRWKQFPNSIKSEELDYYYTIIILSDISRVTLKFFFFSDYRIMCNGICWYCFGHVAKSWLLRRTRRWIRREGESMCNVKNIITASHYITFYLMFYSTVRIRFSIAPPTPFSALLHRTILTVLYWQCLAIWGKLLLPLPFIIRMRWLFMERCSISFLWW